MKLMPWTKAIVVSSCIVLLAACSSAHKRHPTQAMIQQANAEYSDNDQAETSGVPEGRNFRDEVREEGEQVLSKRIYYFDFDRDIVHPVDKPAINANADYLVNHPHAKVLLEGHTDPRGSREYNIGLGERRAKAVAAILTARGVSPAQVRVVSYGAQKLAAPGRTETDYQLDRRVVLVYLQR